MPQNLPKYQEVNFMKWVTSQTSNNVIVKNVISYLVIIKF